MLGLVFAFVGLFLGAPCFRPFTKTSDFGIPMTHEIDVPHDTTALYLFNDSKCVFEDSNGMSVAHRTGLFKWYGSGKSFWKSQYLDSQNIATTFYGCYSTI